MHRGLERLHAYPMSLQSPFFPLEPTSGSRMALKVEWKHASSSLETCVALRPLWCNTAQRRTPCMAYAACRSDQWARGRGANALCLYALSKGQKPRDQLSLVKACQESSERSFDTPA